MIVCDVCAAKPEGATSTLPRPGFESLAFVRVDGSIKEGETRVYFTHLCEECVDMLEEAIGDWANARVAKPAAKGAKKR